MLQTGKESEVSMGETTCSKVESDDSYASLDITLKPSTHRRFSTENQEPGELELCESAAIVS